MAKPIINEKISISGPADSHTDDHHKGHLHIYHVGCHTGNQAGHREFIDVLKGIILNTVEHVLAQVARKAGGSRGAGVAGRNAENQRQNSHDNQLDAIVDNDIHTAARLHLVHQIGDDKRDNTFQNHFNR